VLVCKAYIPTAVLSPPVVLEDNADLPTAVLLQPVVLAPREPKPSAVLKHYLSVLASSARMNLRLCYDSLWC
jgi:hypothetical protein